MAKIDFSREIRIDGKKRICGGWKLSIGFHFGEKYREKFYAEIFGAFAKTFGGTFTVRNAQMACGANQQNFNAN